MSGRPFGTVLNYRGEGLTDQVAFNFEKSNPMISGFKAGHIPVRPLVFPTGDTSMTREPWVNANLYVVDAADESQLISQLVSNANEQAVDILAAMLVWTPASTHDAAKKGLSAILSEVNRSRTSDAWKVDDPALEERIRRALDIPLRMEGVATFGDGNCVFNAWVGDKTSYGYRCSPDQLEALRWILASELRNCDIDNLPEAVSASVNEYLLDVPPGGESLFFDELDQERKKDVFKSFVEECEKAGSYLWAPLVPFLAKALNIPVSLYQDHEAFSSDGWLHFDAAGNACSFPVSDAVAMRFDSVTQHFERVKPPYHPQLEEIRSSTLLKSLISENPPGERKKGADLQLAPVSSDSPGQDHLCGLPLESVPPESAPVPQVPAEQSTASGTSLLGRAATVVGGWFSSVGRWFASWTSGWCG